MYKECKTAQSMNRQLSIAQSLCDMMVQQPYEEISVSSLCKKADIPRKSFYRYFDTKDDAFHFLVDKLLLGSDEYSGGYRRADVQMSKGILKKRFQYFKEQKGLIEAIASNHMSLQTIQRVCETVISQMRELGVTMNIEEEMKVTMTTSIVFAVIMSWHHSEYKTSCDEMAETTFRLLTTPLLELNDESDFR